MLKAHQVKRYDDASRQLRTIADQLGRMNVAGMNPEHVRAIAELAAEMSKLGHELYHLAHERFLAERRGEIGEGS